MMGQMEKICETESTYIICCLTISVTLPLMGTNNISSIRYMLKTNLHFATIKIKVLIIRITDKIQMFQCETIIKKLSKLSKYANGATVSLPETRPVIGWQRIIYSV